MTVRRISLAAFHDECRAQGVSNPNHIAFRCVQCGTLQSMALFRARTKLAPEKIERVIGFSCIGRWADGIGCDWTLGGLFTIHELEVEDPDGQIHPRFVLATSEEARDLEKSVVDQKPSGAGSGDLGPCCNCGETVDVTTIVTLNFAGPEPGHGWGCAQCGLPADGALAVLCDSCVTANQYAAAATGHELIVNICVGYPGEGRRMLRREWEPQAKPHDHDLAKHPEIMDG